MSVGMRIVSLEREIKQVDTEMRQSVAFISDPSDYDSVAYRTRTPQDVQELRDLREKKTRLENLLSELRNQQ
jgi:hypothetical protein